MYLRYMSAIYASECCHRSTAYVSAYFYIYVFIPLNQRSPDCRTEERNRSTIHLLHILYIPTTHVSEVLLQICPHTTEPKEPWLQNGREKQIYYTPTTYTEYPLHVCPRTTIYLPSYHWSKGALTAERKREADLLYTYYMCVSVLLYISPHTTEPKEPWLQNGREKQIYYTPTTCVSAYYNI
jgi:hypothetical protein